MSDRGPLGGSLPLGNREIRRMGFGAMRLTGRGVWGPPADPEQARAVLRRAVEAGVTFIDTADSYGPEVSEELIAETLHPYPPELTIATKGGLERPGPGQWTANGRPEHLKRACEGSLRRLRVDTITLYQLHTVDKAVPFEESLGALAELREEGKIRNVGLSSVRPEHLVRAEAIVPIVSVQNRYNLADRRHDDVLERCETEGLAFIPWFPLGVGDLTARAGALVDVAERHDATPAQIALAWLLHRSPVMVPIPGTSSVAHLEENLAAASIELSLEDLTQLATG